MVLHTLGNIYKKMGNNTVNAERSYRDSIVCLEKINDKDGIAKVYLSFADLYRSQADRYDDAKKYYQLSLDIEIAQEKKKGKKMVLDAYIRFLKSIGEKEVADKLTRKYKNK